MNRMGLLLALVLAAIGAAHSEEPDQVLVTYENEGDRPIVGVSRSMHWSATQVADGAARIEARVPIDSFASGDPKIDSIVRAALRSGRYPFAEVEGVLRLSGFEGTIALGGLQRPLRMPVTIDHDGAQLIVRTSFAIDLPDFEATVPSLGPRLKIAVLARVSADPAAIIAGGALNPG